MSLTRIRKTWNSLAKSNPMWAVLTSRDWDEDSFYKSGEDEIRSLLEEVRDLHPSNSYDEAMDFGCGVGRLTFALSKYYRHVTGVDISTVMIEQARENSRATSNVEFVVNENSRLKTIADEKFDLVLSLIVLQHVPYVYIRIYIEEFLRVVKPGSLVVFQLPTKKLERPKEKRWEGKPLNWGSPSIGKLSYRFVSRALRLGFRVVLDLFLRIRGIIAAQFGPGAPVMLMNYIEEDTISKYVERSGGKMLKVRKDDRAGSEFESRLYFVQKKKG